MSLEARVGVFVIVSLLVLGATVYFVRTAQDVRGQVVYTTYLRHAGGIATGTPVLFAGIRVGQIASVRPSAADPTRIEITFAVKAGTPVNAESIARVGSVTLMSSPTLFLTGGSNNARRLGPGEVVPAQEAISANEIAARLATLADSANDVMALLKHEVPAVTGEARATLANLREISGPKNQKHVESILAELNTMVRRESPKIEHITERLTALAGHADELVVSAGPLVANLDHAVTNVSTTVDAVREPLTNDLAELQRTLENGRALIDSVRRVVGRQRRRHPSNGGVAANGVRERAAPERNAQGAPVESHSDDAARGQDGTAMTNRREGALRAAFALIAALAIGGCGSARYPAHYILNFEPPAQAAAPERGMGISRSRNCAVPTISARAASSTVRRQPKSASTSTTVGPSAQGR